MESEMATFFNFWVGIQKMADSLALPASLVGKADCASLRGRRLFLRWMALWLTRWLVLCCTAPFTTIDQVSIVCKVKEFWFTLAFRFDLHHDNTKFYDLSPPDPNPRFATVYENEKKWIINIC
ncbi:hypothetical protein AVEN_95627-1 [Araneus ventricosus]|uniref:Uncharacterized protein n=1 Tax=Araneus ventricosus TaxID=182803 RepID=A0A4Y2JNU0_ARAVE|nr:hypothetical protein AVEN_95627-1 [Araneus ventricosus]